jgi:hypothetical protein
MHAKFSQNDLSRSEVFFAFFKLNTLTDNFLEKILALNSEVYTILPPKAAPPLTLAKK